VKYINFNSSVSGTDYKDKTGEKFQEINVKMGCMNEVTTYVEKDGHCGQNWRKPLTN
jgi:hypothetical protein